MRKEPMRILLNSILILLLARYSRGQARPSQLQAAEKSAHATNLPSEATVDSFLHQQFGYQPDLTWKISSIKPSTIAGLAEVSVVLASPQGQQLTRFYVGPDGKHALIGDIIPFGAKPFDPAKKALEKGITGPSSGPQGRSGDHRGVRRSAVSRL